MLSGHASLPWSFSSHDFKMCFLEALQSAESLIPGLLASPVRIGTVIQMINTAVSTALARFHSIIFVFQEPHCLERVPHLHAPFPHQLDHLHLPLERALVDGVLDHPLDLPLGQVLPDPSCQRQDPRSDAKIPVKGRLALVRPGSSHGVHGGASRGYDPVIAPAPLWRPTASQCCLVAIRP